MKTVRHQSKALSVGNIDDGFCLDSLLDVVNRGKLVNSLELLSGGKVGIAVDDIRDPAQESFSRRELAHELDTVGYVYLESGDIDKIDAVKDILEVILGLSARYQMVADVHLKAIQDDYLELQKRHDAILASELRYRELAVNLEKRVSDQVRTIEVAQRKMHQQERLASIGQLAAGVAHEINNPVGFIKSNLNCALSYLTTIQSWVGGNNSARESDINDIVADFDSLLKECVEGVDRIAKIVADLKNFSNIDSPEVGLANLNEIIQGICNILRSHILGNAELRLDLKPVPDIKCQPGHIGQALLNVITNSIQAIAGEAGKILIATDRKGDHVIVRITDNGSGIPDEVLSRVFDPFFTTKEVGKGTGLGLTVCRDIVISHRGEINIESRPGAGTTVEMRFPV